MPFNALAKRTTTGSVKVVEENNIVTVQVTKYLSAQGPLIKDHGDGTATVEAGGVRVTGRKVEKKHNAMRD
jgi:hypothetical protein